MGGGGKGGSDEAKRARKEEEARQARIRQGTKRIGDIFSQQFTPDFFEEQAQRYINYANPQLTDQYNDAAKELTFSLARSGNLESSSRGSLAAELDKKLGLQQQAVADQALSYKTSSMDAVEGARANLISMLNATGDAEGAAQDAIRRASVLSQPAAFSPLTNLFADFTSTLGATAAAERAYAMSGGAYGRQGTGLFSPRSGAVVSR